MTLSIAPSLDNVFFFWAGDAAGRLDQINAAICSCRRHNPGSSIFLFTNDLHYEDLGEDVVNRCRPLIVNWTPASLVAGTPFESRAAQLEPENIRARHDGDTPLWVVFSDFFRYLALWRWGGTYLDLDDVSVRPLPRGTNIVSSSVPDTRDREDGFGTLARDRSTRAERYIRLGNDPLVRFEPRHVFLGYCFERVLERPPGLAGSRVLTEVYEQMHGSPGIDVRPAIDVILHPGMGITEFVTRELGWEERWWWSELRRAVYRQRWSTLLRLGTFCLVKNHGWRTLDSTAPARRLSDFACAGESRRGGILRDRKGGDFVSVVIPTHRQQFLADTLAALARQSDTGFEVLVVENGARLRATEAVVRRYSPTLRLRLHHERHLGLNAARNAGGRLAEGDILAFLDDDCEPGPGWIAAIKSRYRSTPRAIVVAGRVVLKFRSRRPGWLVGEFPALLSQLDPPAAGPVENPGVVGANFAVRRVAFGASGGFDEQFGMIGRSVLQLGNDEVEFCRRVELLTGTAPLFDPAVVVRHQVSKERLDIGRFEHRKYGQGISDALLIVNRGRRPVEDALEILERHLYDPGWLNALNGAAEAAPAGDRRLFVDNAIRIRVEYLAGLARGCIEAAGGPLTDDGANARYARRGEAAARRWSGATEKRGPSLLRLAELMVAGAQRKPSLHHWCTRPAVLLGRVAFFRAAKETLLHLEAAPGIAGCRQTAGGLIA